MHILKSNFATVYLLFTKDSITHFSQLQGYDILFLPFQVSVVPSRQRSGVRWFMVNSSTLGFGRESRFVVRFFWFTAVSWDVEENQGL